jgi:hypothetical protein
MAGQRANRSKYSGHDFDKRWMLFPLPLRWTLSEEGANDFADVFCALDSVEGTLSEEPETRFELATPAWPNGQPFVLTARQSLSLAAFRLLPPLPLARRTRHPTIR